MEKTFNYLSEKVRYLEDITIENIGECIIEANDDMGRFWYLWVKTDEGYSRVLQFGPIVSEDYDKYLLKKFTCEYQYYSYSDTKLIKLIETFLNMRDITQAREISEDELREKCHVDIFKYMEDR